MMTTQERENEEAGVLVMMLKIPPHAEYQKMTKQVSLYKFSLYLLYLSGGRGSNHGDPPPKMAMRRFSLKVEFNFQPGNPPGIGDSCQM